MIPGPQIRADFRGWCRSADSHRFSRMVPDPQIHAGSRGGYRSADAGSSPCSIRRAAIRDYLRSIDKALAATDVIVRGRVIAVRDEQHAREFDHPQPPTLSVGNRCSSCTWHEPPSTKHLVTNTSDTGHRTTSRPRMRAASVPAALCTYGRGAIRDPFSGVRKAVQATARPIDAGQAAAGARGTETRG